MDELIILIIRALVRAFSGSTQLPANRADPRKQSGQQTQLGARTQLNQRTQFSQRSQLIEQRGDSDVLMARMPPAPRNTPTLQNSPPTRTVPFVKRSPGNSANTSSRRITAPNGAKKSPGSQRRTPPALPARADVVSPRKPAPPAPPTPATIAVVQPLNSSARLTASDVRKRLNSENIRAQIILNEVLQQPLCMNEEY